MNLDNLRELISRHVKEYPHRNIIISANFGTTFYGALDDIKGIKNILDEVTVKGTISNFTIHVDGALFGILMPIFKTFGDVENYFSDELGINTMAISGHKVLGTLVSGIALVRKDMYEIAGSKRIEYAGNIRDVTISGCRPSMMVLCLHNTLYSLGINEKNDILENIVEVNKNHAAYLYSKLVEILGEEEVFWDLLTLIFKKPSDELIKKYFLMVIGKKVSITVLQHINKEKIDNFTQEFFEEVNR